MLVAFRLPQEMIDSMATVAGAAPAFSYSRFGFALDVYPNRIEVVSGTWIKKREAILLRNVTDVQVAGVTRKLTVVTNDGKKHEFNVGTKSEDARATIAGLI